MLNVVPHAAPASCLFVLVMPQESDTLLKDIPNIILLMQPFDRQLQKPQGLKAIL